MGNNNIFIDVNADRMNILKRDKNKKLIYIGRPTCSGCIVLEPVLKKELERYNLDIYYYNTEEAKKIEFDKFQDIKKNFKVEHIPLILYYEGEDHISRFDFYDFEKSQDSIDKFIKDTILK